MPLETPGSPCEHTTWCQLWQISGYYTNDRNCSAFYVLLNGIILGLLEQVHHLLYEALTTYPS